MEELDKLFNSKIETIHQGLNYTKKMEQNELKCPNCGRIMSYYNTHSLKVMCGDREVVRQRTYGKTKVTETSEHYIPILVCENCYKRRKNIVMIIGVLFLLVIPAIFYYLGGIIACIVLFFIGMGILGGALNLSEKLSIPLDEAKEIEKEQDLYRFQKIINEGI